jgi:hypothetical protein
MVQTTFCVEARLYHASHVFCTPHLLQVLPQQIAQLGTGTSIIGYNSSLIEDQKCSAVWPFFQ